jgi:uncharacterized delta-60 repeat protein
MKKILLSFLVSLFGSMALLAQPVIIQQPRSVTSALGGVATFNCLVGDAEPISYQWFRGNTALTDFGNVSGSASYTLTVSNVARTDLGNYFVVVADSFASITSSVAVLTLNSATVDTTYNVPSHQGQIVAIALLPDGKSLVSSQWSWPDGSGRSIARLNTDGTLDLAFDASNNVVGTPNSISIQADGKIIAGARYLVRLYPDGSRDTNFNLDVGGTVFSTMVQSDGKILVGGPFTTMAGVARSQIARLNADGTLDADFNPGADGPISSFQIQPDGKILVGGRFTTLGGMPRSNIGRLNPDGTIDPDFNPGISAPPPGYYTCLAIQADGKILVGGQFNTLGGQSRSCIGRLNPDGTVDSTFNADASAQVTTFAVQTDGKILVGGQFGGLSGQGRGKIGRLNPDGSVDTAFNPGANNGVWSIELQQDGKILAGGVFATLSGQGLNCIGRLNNTAPATESLTYDGTNITWLRRGTLPEVWRTTFEQSTDGTNWTMLGTGARVSGGWSLAGVTGVEGIIRARGYSTGGDGWSSGLLETDMNVTNISVSSQPQSSTNSLGTTTTFNVVVNGFTPFAYQWFKGGNALTDGGNVSGSATATLTLSNLLAADAGNYFVVITNAYGAVTSSVANLTVLLPAQSFGGQIVASGGLQLQFSGTPNYPYILQTATNLTPPVNWQSILTNPADANGNWSFTVTNLPAPAGYYRAVAQ